MGRGISECHRNGMGRIRERISGKKRGASTSFSEVNNSICGGGHEEGPSRGLIRSAQKSTRRMGRKQERVF